MRYFSALIKPASSLCNMSCSYCFYADVSNNRNVKSYGIMNIKTAKILIDKLYEKYVDETTFSFAFQGGEPTLAGIEFFEEFASYATENLRKKSKIVFSLQTNGYSIDEKWCALFKKYNFLIGVSLDATKEIHDYYRKTNANDTTYKNVLNTIKLFDKFSVEYNILSVISRGFAKHPKAVFSSYMKNGFKFLQLIPCLNPIGIQINEKTDLTPRLYASFLIETFNLWENEIKKDNWISIREFENIILKLKGQMAEQCGMMGVCSPQFVMEADGSVFPCDFFVLDKYYSGSIIENSIEEIEKSEGIVRFLSDTISLHPLCKSCKVFNICKGGCKRYREFYKSEDGYCPYQEFLYSTIDRFVQIERTLS